MTKEKITKDLIKHDLHRYIPGKYSFRKLLKGFRSQGFRYMFLVRKAAAGNKLSTFFYRLFLRHYTYKYGFQIPHNVPIGPGFYIGHFGTIVVSVNAKIGKNCNIAHGVTIGRAKRGDTIGSPTIGDYVWMGTNSIIVGKITIGNNVLIAPGAYVNFDVPDNSLVIGNPGKIIPKENPVAEYINNTID